MIFAQFLDVRDQSAKEQENLARKSSQVATDLDKTKRDRDALQARLSGAQRIVDELRRQLEQDENREKQLQRQRDLVSQSLAQMFRLSPAAMQQALKPLMTNAQSKADLEKLRAMLDDLQKKKPHQIVRHVVKVRELLKRCDVWELHVDRRNIAQLSIAGKTRQFRYAATPLKLTGDDDKDQPERRRYFQELKKDFESKLFGVYKSLPQTKNVIIVLISRGPETTVGTYFAAKLGTQDMADHVATSSVPRVHVVYTDLGKLRFEPAGTRETDPSP